MKMTEQEQRTMMRRVSKAISCIQDGEDATAVLSRIYCENLTDKSPRQGQLMARDLMRWMKVFQNGYDRAQDDPEKYLDQCLEDALAGLPQEQRQAQKAAFYRELENQPDPFSMDAGTFSDWNRAKNAAGEEMTLAVTAMVLYTMAKNGELSGLFREASLSQVVLSVCAEQKCREIRFAQAQGILSEEKAEKRMKGLRSAFYGLMAGAAVLGGGILVANSLAALVGLAAGILIWTGGTAYLLYRMFADMVRGEHLPRMDVVDVSEEVEEESVPVYRKFLPRIRQKAKTRRAEEAAPQRNSN